MFDFSKLQDVSRLASQAKELQLKQDRFQEKQLTLLNEISQKLEKVVQLLQDRR